MIVFTSDNGPYLKNAAGPSGNSESWDRYHGPFQGNKDNVLEAGIRVPAIVSWPRTIPGGQTLGIPVHGCDWLPTLYSLTRSEPPTDAKPLDGMNLMPLLRGESTNAVTKRFLPFQKNRYTPVAHSDAAIRSGRWKLFWPGVPETTRKDGARDNPSYRRGLTHPHWEMPLDPVLPDYAGITTRPPQLFDLVADPSERHDLSARHPEIVKRLSQSYDTWFDEVYTEWKKANRRIVEHDRGYWTRRGHPSPHQLDPSQNQ